jgi:hypothetical protein
MYAKKEGFMERDAHIPATYTTYPHGQRIKYEEKIIPVFYIMTDPVP